MALGFFNEVGISEVTANVPALDTTLPLV